VSRNFTSFMNERSISYRMVSTLLEILHQEFQKIIPLWYWKTREGNTKGSQAFPGEKVKTLAFFPRRPKVEKVRDDVIEIKINYSVFLRSSLLNLNGIPAIAGFPWISSIEDFYGNVEYQWLKIKSTKDFYDINEAEGYYSDEEYKFSLTDKYLLEPPYSDNLENFDKEEIKRIMRTEPASFSWGEVIDVFNKVKDLPYSSFYTHSIFGSYGRYKPIYFVCV
jgi:hypothetical protein